MEAVLNSTHIWSYIGEARSFCQLRLSTVPTRLQYEKQVRLLAGHASAQKLIEALIT